MDLNLRSNTFFILFPTLLYIQYTRTNRQFSQVQGSTLVYITMSCHGSPSLTGVYHRITSVDILNVIIRSLLWMSSQYSYLTWLLSRSDGQNLTPQCAVRRNGCSTAANRGSSSIYWKRIPLSYMWYKWQKWFSALFWNVGRPSGSSFFHFLIFASLLS